jgi:alpha-tubulin suppressor-like RCC1 family protein
MSTFPRFAGRLLLAAALTGCGSEPPTAPPVDLATTTAAAVYTQVVAGGQQSCAIASNGHTYCWGNGPALGAGTVFQSSKPVRVLGNHVFVQISAGTEHTCAVTSDNRAYCWGDNSFGQIGDGTTSLNPRFTPVAVAGGHHFRHVRAGGHHTCALDTDNKLFCWGENSRGQLGVGDNVARAVPTRVLGGLTIKQFIAGYQHTCAVTTAAKGYCWGRNQEGQLGTERSSGSLKPAAVTGGLSWKQIVAGSDHTCGISTVNDRGYCWGGLSEDYNGQLGTGGFVGSRVPLAVAGTRHWRQVNAGFLHSCGVTLANAGFCWGFDFWGQNGDGGNAPVVRQPTPVSGNLSFVGIAVGVHQPPPFSTDGFAIHTCGITTDGRVFCWGWNANGQLGNGTSNNVIRTPVQALPPT